MRDVVINVKLSNFEKAKENTEKKHYCASKDCILAEAFGESLPGYKIHGVSSRVRAKDLEGNEVLLEPSEINDCWLYDYFINKFDSEQWDEISELFKNTRDSIEMTFTEYTLPEWSLVS